MSQEMSEVEALIAKTYTTDPGSKDNKEEDKEDRRDIVYLKEQLEELIKEKQELKVEYDTSVREYIDQQSLILTVEWIEKQKEKLIKRRAKEAAIIKMDRDKCEKLIKDCFNIAQEYKKVYSPEEEKDSVVNQTSTKKKKNKKRKKKKEIIIGAVALDALSEHFKYFSIPPPKKKEDLEKSIKQLEDKLKEINNKRLTETIGIEYEDYENHSTNVSAWSYAK